MQLLRRRGEDAIHSCYYINTDTIEQARRELGLNVAVIARPDWIMDCDGARHLIIETARGIHTRCWVAEHRGVRFLIVYGRFGRIRATSCEIDFALTQEVVSLLGIRNVVGTFTAGSVKAEGRAGDVYVPSDLIGFGPFNHYRNHNFRNVDMLQPFCAEVRHALVTSANEQRIEPFTPGGVYACFHGYPRIETNAELEFYAKIGCDLVGQTLDPEATLAREAGCHYAAIAATIDDRPLREAFAKGDVKARQVIDAHIAQGRRKTFDVFLGALPALAAERMRTCNCVEDGKSTTTRNWNFYYQPRFIGEFE